MERALTIDPKSLPELERQDRKPYNPAAVELLKVLLRMTCDTEGVAAKIVATVDDLEAIAADDEANVPALRGWRRGLFGEKALALKNGHLALAFSSGKVVAVKR